MKSTRLPKKALAMIENQTLIEHVIDRMKESKKADHVILCTSKHPDDKILLEIAERKGVPSIAGSEEDVMGRFLEAIDKVRADIVVRVTGDNPLTSPEFIDNAIEHHVKTNADYTYTTNLPQGTKGEVISVRALKKAHTMAEDPKFSEYMTWYFTDNPDVFKIEKGPVEEGMKRPNYRLTVDTPEDLEIVKEIYKKLYVPGEIVSLKDAIKFLDETPEVVEINSGVVSKSVRDKVNVKLRKNPKVTVYITSYNYENYIGKAIESVLNQTFQDFELLIFDDGSTDGSRKVLEVYDDNPKVNVFYQENKGLPATCNEALKNAKGDFIIRLDADDYFDENILMVLSNFLEKNEEVASVYPDYYEIDENNNVLGIVRRKKIGEESKLLDLPAHGACTMIRRKCLDELGGYSADVKCQDGYDLWIRLIQKFKPSNVNLPLFYYRKHSESSTTNSKKILDARKEIKEKFVEENGKNVKRCVIIPIRGDSRVYSGLALKEVAGKPLMFYAIDSALKSGVDKVVVTTDDKIIGEKAKEFGAEVIMRPEELAKKNTPIEPTILFVLSELERNGFVPELVGVYFYTSPLISEKNIKEAMNTVLIFNADSVISVKENPRFMYKHGENGLEPLFEKRKLKLERDFLFEESGGIIVSKRNAINENSLLGEKIGHVILTENEAVDIEDKFTFWLASKILENKEEVDSLENRKVIRGY